MYVNLIFSNKMLIHSGKIESGFIKWALYGFSNHHLNPEVFEIQPKAKIRTEGEEKNTFAYFKISKLSAGDEFNFRCAIQFYTIPLNIPLISFSFNEYPNQIITKYCSYSKYWPIYDKEIQKIAADLKKESKNDVKKFLKDTYKFVEKSVKLRENMNERLGASRALQEKIGDCDEFSDLFITILRAAKVPARRVVGIYISKNKHEFHAWTEVFIPHYNTFIPFDIALNYFSSISQFHIIRLKMAQSEYPPFVYVKYKGSSNVNLEFTENDLEKIEILYPNE